MRNILIIGTNRGIGLALVQRYLENGDKVWALCRKKSEELDKTEATILEGVDVLDLDSLRKAASELEGTSFDIMIHNAGVWADENIQDMQQSDFDEMTRALEVNSIAPIKSVTSFMSLLKENGKIGLMSSRMGSIADNTSGGRYAYRMSKAALNAAGKSLSYDFPNHPVAILHPGFVRTDMTNHQGLIDADESAAGLFRVMEKLGADNTGRFYHSNGEELPW
jgi:NAD(P)-dependent dehydrogenase (short-subunit alcohol dehydrogenase family)